MKLRPPPSFIGENLSRAKAVLVAAVTGLALGGCVAGLMASAAGMAVRGVSGTPRSNAHLQPVAQGACSDRAAPHGTVHIIDVVQSSVDKIVIWGTVDDGKQRRSFECGFKSTITYFKLRDIRPAQ